MCKFNKVNTNNIIYFYFFSHFPTTVVAKAFPKTFVALLNIPQKWSIGRIKAIPSMGILNMPQVVATTTKHALNVIWEVQKKLSL